ncbi:sporulation protein YpjB [Metabacillus sp. B2-18]|uniref:sporulation protein YpjB n=1 Tax=Metabacillus sp. B2-18 TaxID=2897333 RepID=UPI001E4FDD69|nr:sporulation protein YpjB [Metabacillus sp. B2-18]UGB29245.1 sporulation protein YpjB [Metabacillus sp. B2-18]
MKKLLLTIIIGMLLFHIKPAFAAETYDWKSLNKISDTALQLAKQERFEESAQLLNYFTVKFEEIPIDRNVISLDHYRTITNTQETAQDLLLNEKVSTIEKVRSLTKFRLVVDAMVSEHQPLWGSMETSIMETFSQMKSDVEQGDKESFQHDFNEFLSLYEVIYPSIQVDLDFQRIKRMDAHISVVEDRLFHEIPVTSRVKQLTVMEEELKAIFDRVKEDEADPSLLWVMISTGSVILLALSYSGWKKYRGEKEKQPKREKEKQ